MLLVIALALHSPNSPWSAEKYREHQQASREYPKDEDAARESRVWLRGVLEDGRPHKSAKQGEETKSESEQYTTALDLSAQWATAIAAAEMVALTRLQILFGLLGLIALAYTLYLTRESVRAANRTADEAKLSSERQLRAYIEVNDVKFIEGTSDRPPHVRMRVKNAGQTPAKKLKMIWSCELNPANQSVFKLDGQLEEFGTLGPGQDRSPYGEPRFTDWPEYKKLIAPNKFGAFVYGKIIYQDVFGTERETNFRFFWPLSVIDHGTGDFSICQDGNDTT